RAAMIEALRQDYIRTARAKGVGTGRLVLRHALRNAMIPVVTVLALDFGTLFSGALVTETIFAYLGMGKTIFDAVMGNDYNLALIGLLFATGVVLLANLLADLAYAWLDPRIVYRGGRLRAARGGPDRSRGRPVRRRAPPGRRGRAAPRPSVAALPQAPPGRGKRRAAARPGR